MAALPLRRCLAAWVLGRLLLGLLWQGEGGFLCTDDEELAAKAICYAGCYESLLSQHIIAPSKEVRANQAPPSP